MWSRCVLSTITETVLPPFFSRGVISWQNAVNAPSCLPAGFPLTETSETMLAPSPRIKYLLPGLGVTGSVRV